MPLTGYSFKQERLEEAARARNTALAAQKSLADRRYNLSQAIETARITAIGKDGKEACQGALAGAAGELEVLQAPLPTGATKDEGRRRRQEIRSAEGKIRLLQALVDMDGIGRVNAIIDANNAVDIAQGHCDEAAQEVARTEQEATRLEAEANALPDLNPSWRKDHSAAQSIRNLEADLRKMRDDLTRLGQNAPPTAVQYCRDLEAKIDHDAHHVNCVRCHAEHGIDRTGEAKAAVGEQLAELERLAKLDGEDGLTEQQRQDRLMGQDLEALRSRGQGKMIGVLLCRDSTGGAVTLRAFSGDVAGADDLAGWCPHIPPGSSMTTANGMVVPLDALPHSENTPHGVCAAPKMIQEAHRNNLTIIGIAEAWYGGGVVQPHGALVASCTTCKSNLDVQLCPSYPTV